MSSFFIPIFNTVWESSLGTLFSFILGFPLSYLLYKTWFFGRNLLRSIINSSFMIPSLAMGIAISNLFKDSPISDSPLPILLAFSIFNVSLISRTIGSKWVTINPELELSFLAMGFSKVQVFFYSTLRELKASIVSSIVMVFLFCSSSFGTVLILGGNKYRNIETQIYREVFSLGDTKSGIFLSLIQSVVILTVIILTKRFGENLEPIDYIKTKPTSIIGIVYCSFIALLSLLPLISIASSIFQNLQYLTTTTNEFINSFYTSITLSLAGIVICSMLVILCFWIRIDNSSLIFATLGISPVIVGLILFLVSTFSFYKWGNFWTIIPIVISQSLVSIPIILRVLSPVVRSISNDSKDLAISLGLTKFQKFLFLYKDILPRCIGITVCFSFAVTFSEFGATCFLVRPGILSTLPIKIMKYFSLPGIENYMLALFGTLIMMSFGYILNFVISRIS